MKQKQCEWVERSVVRDVRERKKEQQPRGAQSAASRELRHAGGPVVGDARVLLPLAPHEERDAAADREQHDCRQNQQQNAPPCDAWAIAL